MKTARAGPGLAALLLLAASPGAVWALSLRQSARELRLDELRAGAQYDVGAGGGSLRIGNSGHDQARVSWRFAAPAAAELVDGYEPIPDPAWLEAGGPLVLEPGGERTLAARLTIPEGAGKPGAQYQAQAVTVGEGAGGLRLELRSRLLLRFADGKRPGRERPRREGGEFRLFPAEASAGPVPLGTRRGLDARLKVANPNDGPAAFAARVLAGGSAPDPSFVQVEPARLVIAAGRVGEFALSAEIPDQARYRGRDWEFSVEVRMEQGGPPQLFRLRLRTEREAGR